MCLIPIDGYMKNTLTSVQPFQSPLRCKNWLFKYRCFKNWPLKGSLRNRNARKIFLLGILSSLLVQIFKYCDASGALGLFLTEILQCFYDLFTSSEWYENLVKGLALTI